jgi:hypothetical protein
MLAFKSAQRVNIKLLVKLKKSAMEKFQLLTEAYGETKRQSMQSKSATSPRPKRARMSRSKFKAMLIIFFDIRGIVMAELVPSGQRVNQQYYLEVLVKLHERVRWKRPELCRHQGNAPAHNTL